MSGRTRRRLRIAHVTTVHRWDDGRIFDRQCRTLADFGHEVTLLASDAPNSSIDGVAVRDLGTRRHRFDRMTRLQYVAARAITDIRPDIVVLHDPELLLLAATKVWRRHAVVYDAHEDYAAQLRDKEWLPAPVRGPASALLGRLEAMVSRRADLVTCATPAIARRFRRHRSAIVLNRPRLRDLPPLDDARSSRSAGGDASVCFVGDLRAVRGAHALIGAMPLVNRAHEAELVLVGRITPQGLRDELERHNGWRHVVDRGWRDRAEVYREIGSADVAVLPFLHAENHVESQPNKLFEYLMMGTPVVVTDFELWRTITKECDARAEFAASGDPRSIAAAIGRLLDDPPTSTERRAAAERARRVFSWETLEDDFVAEIEAVIGDRR